MIHKDLYWNVKGKAYTFKVPNPRQVIQIEVLKSQLSQSQYTRLILNKTRMAEMALDMIDIKAYISVLAPENFRDDMKIPIEEMGLADFKELHKSFQEHMTPWIREWEEFLTAPPVKETPQPPAIETQANAASK